MSQMPTTQELLRSMATDQEEEDQALPPPEGTDADIVDSLLGIGVFLSSPPPGSSATKAAATTAGSSTAATTTPRTPTTLATSSMPTTGDNNGGLPRPAGARTPGFEARTARLSQRYVSPTRTVPRTAKRSKSGMFLPSDDDDSDDDDDDAFAGLGATPAHPPPMSRLMMLAHRAVSSSSSSLASTTAQVISADGAQGMAYDESKGNATRGGKALALLQPARVAKHVPRAAAVAAASDQTRAVLSPVPFSVSLRSSAATSPSSSAAGTAVSSRAASPRTESRGPVPRPPPALVWPLSSPPPISSRSPSPPPAPLPVVVNGTLADSPAPANDPFVMQPTDLLPPPPRQNNVLISLPLRRRKREEEAETQEMVSSPSSLAKTPAAKRRKLHDTLVSATVLAAQEEEVGATPRTVRSSRRAAARAMSPVPAFSISAVAASVPPSPSPLIVEQPVSASAVDQISASAAEIAPALQDTASLEAMLQTQEQYLADLKRLAGLYREAEDLAREVGYF
ncbi:hypothetical protein BC828DRAFT_382484 [Blastocladiella britannica]|nr:hypothetical protein BC828DRAFT_382484 [Blastocladiella britannica]